MSLRISGRLESTVPVVVRLSAPNITPPLNLIAMLGC
jgi:hypothetical protein